MNSNLVADTIYTQLSSIHARVYRNEAPRVPTFPYVVFDVETVNDSYPSNDYYVYVNVYDEPNASVRAISDIADLIDALDNTVVNVSGLNLHITKILRQFISNKELTTSKAINLQYNARVYFK